MTWLFVILIVFPDGGTLNVKSQVYQNETECRKELSQTVSENNGYIKNQIGYFEAEASNGQIFDWKTMCSSMESSPTNDL